MLGGKSRSLKFDADELFNPSFAIIHKRHSSLCFASDDTFVCGDDASICDDDASIRGDDASICDDEE